MRQPVFFERNKVGRVYLGGKLFEGFFGDSAEDGFFPEEWIASSVEALNREKVREREGVSRIAGTGQYFDEYLKENPKEILGSRGKMRILVKVLDSAIRLPAQAHPDKAYSAKYFGSQYGKTESWILLDAREGAKLCFGFRDGVDRERFSAAIDASLQDKEAMSVLMKDIIPEKNDCFLVPARTVHAIGAGCLILEIQEPTDFTIQPEHWCGDYKLNDQEMYLGLSKEVAMDCFDFTQAPDTKMIPGIIKEAPGTIVENLIGPEHTDCFVVNRIKLNQGSFDLNIQDSYGVYVVTEGTGKLVGEGFEKALKKGDYFFMPSCLMGQYEIQGSMECVECY